MTKLLRFNLSGNTLFKGQPPRIIIEDSGTCLEDYKTEEEEWDDREYNYLHPTTLRDICILLYEACGQGVMWQLSRELSERLRLDKKDVHLVIEKIVREYAEMNEEAGTHAYKKYAKYIKTRDSDPDETE